MVTIQKTPIDTHSLLTSVIHADAGAVVLFVGTTRRITDGQETTQLHYECYETMAQQKLDELETRARERWPIRQCAIAHRTGRVAVGEASVAVAVSTPHRRDAFAAGEWLIDRLKELVPIWKEEHFADGSQQWVHPGVASQPAPRSRSDHD